MTPPTAYSMLFKFQVFPIFCQVSESMDISHFKIHMAFPGSLLPEIRLVLK